MVNKGVNVGAGDGFWFFVADGMDEDFEVATVVNGGAAFAKPSFEVLLESSQCLFHVGLLYL